MISVLPIAAVMGWIGRNHLMASPATSQPAFAGITVPKRAGAWNARGRNRRRNRPHHRRPLSVTRRDLAGTGAGSNSRCRLSWYVVRGVCAQPSGEPAIAMVVIVVRPARSIRSVLVRNRI